MGIATLVLLPVASNVIGAGSTLRELALVVVCGGISAGVFTVLAMALRIEEWRWLAGMLRQRLGS